MGYLIIIHALYAFSYISSLLSWASAAAPVMVLNIISDLMSREISTEVKVFLKSQII